MPFLSSHVRRRQVSPRRPLITLSMRMAFSFILLALYLLISLISSQFHKSLGLPAATCASAGLHRPRDKLTLCTATWPPISAPPLRLRRSHRFCGPIAGFNHDASKNLLRVLPNALQHVRECYSNTLQCHMLKSYPVPVSHPCRGA